MANTVVFNQKTESMKFEDLKIGDVFMHNFSNVLCKAQFHYIKVEKSVSSYDNVSNAICIEDGSYVFFDKEQNVKKFIGEIALNGIFVEFECEV